jgi:hypothetical protein
MPKLVLHLAIPSPDFSLTEARAVTDMMMMMGVPVMEAEVAYMNAVIEHNESALEEVAVKYRLLGDE